MTETLGDNKIDEQTNLAHWERAFQRPFYNIPSVFRKECPKMSDFLVNFCIWLSSLMSGDSANAVPH